MVGAANVSLIKSSRHGERQVNCGWPNLAVSLSRIELMNDLVGVSAEYYTWMSKFAERNATRSKNTWPTMVHCAPHLVIRDIRSPTACCRCFCKSWSLLSLSQVATPQLGCQSHVLASAATKPCPVCAKAAKRLSMALQIVRDGSNSRPCRQAHNANSRSRQ